MRLRAEGVIFLTLLFSTFAVRKIKPLHLLQGRLHPRIDTFQDCPYNRPENFHFINVTSMKYGAHDFFLNGNFQIGKEIRTVKSFIKIKRCPTTAEATCEHFQTWTFGKEGCTMMLQEDVPWVGLFHRVTPELNCPALKGVYTFENATLDMKHMQFLSVGSNGKELLENYN